MLALLFSNRSWLALVLGLFLGACDDPSERALKHYDRGLSLLEESAPEKAALEFRNALRLDEGFVAARFELAKILEQAGELNGALANLREVIETDPAHAAARVRLANAMLMANEPKQAMAHAEIAVRAAPKLPAALIARSMAAYRLGNTVFALQDAKRALLLDPGNAEAGLVMAIERYDAGAQADAHTLLDQFIQLEPNAFTLHLTKLRYLSTDGNQLGVGKQLGRMIQQFPKNAELRRSMVDWHLHAGDLSAAEQELQKLQKLLPDDIEPIRARVGLIARSKGNQAARQILVEEINQAINPDPLRLQLALFDYEIGEHDAAISQLNQLIDDATDAEVAAQARLSLARAQGASQDFAAVDATTTSILDMDPGNADALALRSAARLGRDSVEAALFDIRGALTEQPRNTDFLTLAAEIYQRNGSPVLAGESLASAVRESGHRWNTVRVYAAHLQQIGDHRGIQTLLDETYRKHPDNAQVIEALARYHLKQQDWVKAERLAGALEPYDETAATQVSAQIHLGRQQHAEALASLDKLSGKIGAPALLSAKVRAHLQAGNRSGAKQVIDAGLVATPKDPDLLRLSAAWYDLAGQPHLAERMYRKSIAEASEQPSGYLLLASLLDRTGKQTEAKQVLDDGLQIFPAHPVIRLQLATLAMRKGDHVAAIQHFEQIYLDHPSSLLAANNLASALAEYHSDDPDQVKRAEVIARRLAGTANPAFKDTYGWTRVLAGDPKAGLPDLEAAAKQLPQNPWVQYHAGIAQFKLGRPKEAKHYLQAALQLSRETPFPPREKIKQLIDALAG